jgi:hypothetical protein
VAVSWDEAAPLVMTDRVPPKESEEEEL